MKRIKLITPALIGTMLSFMMFSCSKSDPVASTPATNSDYKINIQATQFDPSTLTMLPNSRVVWTNTDGAMHSVVSDDGTSFNSGNISNGGTFSFTPTATGTYSYHCGIHPSVTGTINVVIR